MIEDIKASVEVLRLAEANESFVTWYTSYTDSRNNVIYYYDEAADMYDTSISQLSVADSYLKAAKIKLNVLKDYNSTEFFARDLEYRSNQINKLNKYVNIYSKLLIANKNELYEINYGTAEKGDEYFNQINNELIPEFNDNLYAQSDANEKVDLHWGKNWHTPAIPS